MRGFEKLYWAGPPSEAAAALERGLVVERQAGSRFTVLHRYAETGLDRFDLFDKTPLPFSLIEIDAGRMPPGSFQEFPPDGVMLDIRGEHVICTARIPASLLRAVQAPAPEMEAGPAGPRR